MFETKEAQKELFTTFVFYSSPLVCQNQALFELLPTIAITVIVCYYSPLGNSVPTRTLTGSQEPQPGANMATTKLPLGEYLTFHLGEKEYGIDILRVREIRSYETPTRVDGAPDFLKGMIHLHGVIVPIIDLRLMFSVEAVYHTFTVVIVLNIRGRVIGVVVDSVSNVIELDSKAILPAPEVGDGGTKFILGIGMVSMGEGKVSIEHYVHVLDIEGLLTSTEMGLFST